MTRQDLEQAKQRTLARILELHEQGRNAVEIGESIGLTHGRVRAILRAEGIKANPMLRGAAAAPPAPNAALMFKPRPPAPKQKAEPKPPPDPPVNTPAPRATHEQIVADLERFQAKRRARLDTLERRLTQ